MSELDQEGPRQRPSPEALLAEVTQSERAQLRLFLGAAPGVGKTYEMLTTARRKIADGADLVVGVVETHGRADTQALLAGLPIVPRRRIAYRGRVLEEMDLDAILARRPEIVLVDELAHSNAAGSRHEKRYQDVLELLEAGIEVWSTLNVQHVESLNDVVAQITRVRVRETVPDSILDMADIELIDITPTDLIERLQEGKVYLGEQAQRALTHYFSPGNLTALRELALRRTAQHVDEQMLGYMRAHAISGPWAAGERILVCIDERPGAAQLVRQGKRLADQLRAPWTVLHVETARSARLAEASRDRIADTLRLAESLGARSLTVPGDRIVPVVLTYAREHNITQIVIGKAARSRMFELTHGSVVDELVRRSGDITVQVIAGARETVPAKTVHTRAPQEKPRLLPYLVSTLFVLGAGAVAVGVDQLVEVPNVSLVFLTAVLLAATIYGLAASIYASFLGVLAYNFLLTEPRYTFTVNDPQNVVALFVFLVTAVLFSSIAARMRLQTVLAQRQARRTAELHAFSRKLASTADLYDVLWAAAHQMASMLKAEVIILLPDQGQLVPQAGYPPEDELNADDLAAARWSFEHNQPAGRGAPTLPGAARLFMPMRTRGGAVGVAGLKRKGESALLSPEERRLLDALMDQTALAVERMQFAAGIEEARLLTRTEKLRSALLTSVSHDLRTPLSAIMGALDTLRAHGDVHDEATRSELLATAHEEAERLNRFVANLLDMTRLDTGAIEPRCLVLELETWLPELCRRLARILGEHTVVLDLATSLPPLWLDPVLTEQILTNLLDNAVKHAPPGSTITIAARGAGDGGVEVEILDEGTGITAEALPRLFDRFYRAEGGDRRRAGTGLGLAIAKGFTEAMGGAIEAANRADRRGAMFRLRFSPGIVGRALKQLANDPPRNGGSGTQPAIADRPRELAAPVPRP